MGDFKTLSTKRKQLTIRVHDTKIFDYLDKISDILGNRSTAVNRCLAAGVPIVCRELFGREPKAAGASETTAVRTASNDEELNKIANSVKQIRDIQDDMLVAMSALLYMVNTLYNVKVAEIEDEEVNADLIESGYFSDTPDALSDLVANIDKRKVSIAKQRSRVLND